MLKDGTHNASFYETRAQTVRQGWDKLPLGTASGTTSAGGVPLKFVSEGLCMEMSIPRQ